MFGYLLIQYFLKLATTHTHSSIDASLSQYNFAAQSALQSTCREAIWIECFSAPKHQNTIEEKPHQKLVDSLRPVIELEHTQFNTPPDLVASRSMLYPKLLQVSVFRPLRPPTIHNSVHDLKLPLLALPEIFTLPPPMRCRREYQNQYNDLETVTPLKDLWITHRLTGRNPNRNIFMDVYHSPFRNEDNQLSLPFIPDVSILDSRHPAANFMDA